MTEFFIMDKKIFDKVFGWKCKGFSKESIVNSATSNNGFSPKITFSYYSIIAVMFERNCLHQDKVFLVRDSHPSSSE